MTSPLHKGGDSRRGILLFLSMSFIVVPFLLPNCLYSRGSLSDKSSLLHAICVIFTFVVYSCPFVHYHVCTFRSGVPANRTSSRTGINVEYIDLGLLTMWGRNES